eukprot:TRINITY_DN9382_c0_g2_i1.p1 TRINITY_DN9382_c0_g2~~TRINITY_DN9382_c0_g2_i1.p1  ORF type:complete len:232 (+),score=53.81 TRINITY_DN9382_c0_g2_i1:93-788(+)
MTGGWAVGLHPMPVPPAGQNARGRMALKFASVAVGLLMVLYGGLGKGTFVLGFPEYTTLAGTCANAEDCPCKSFYFVAQLTVTMHICAAASLSALFLLPFLAWTKLSATLAKIVIPTFVERVWLAYEVSSTATLVGMLVTFFGKFCDDTLQGIGALGHGPLLVAVCHLLCHNAIWHLPPQGLIGVQFAHPRGRYERYTNEHQLIPLTKRQSSTFSWATRPVARDRSASSKK